jgi:steroid delta-isomerase-like uncharacterized protein
MSEPNKTVVRRLIEDHWNGKQAALVEDCFAPSVTLYTPDGMLSQLEGASFLLQAYATAFPDFRIAIDDMLAEGDQVAVRYTFTGTHLGPLAELPATGRAVSMPNGVLIFRLTEGKVTEGHFSWDRYAMLQQLGVLPSSASAGA